MRHVNDRNRNVIIFKRMSSGGRTRKASQELVLQSNEMAAGHDHVIAQDFDPTGAAGRTPDRVTSFDQGLFQSSAGQLSERFDDQGIIDIPDMRDFEPEPIPSDEYVRPLLLPPERGGRRRRRENYGKVDLNKPAVPFGGTGLPALQAQINFEPSWRELRGSSFTGLGGVPTKGPTTTLNKFRARRLPGAKGPSSHDTHRVEMNIDYITARNLANTPNRMYGFDNTAMGQFMILRAITDDSAPQYNNIANRAKLAAGRPATLQQQATFKAQLSNEIALGTAGSYRPDPTMGMEAHRGYDAPHTNLNDSTPMMPAARMPKGNDPYLDIEGPLGMDMAAEWVPNTHVYGEITTALGTDSRYSLSHKAPQYYGRGKYAVVEGGFEGMRRNYFRSRYDPNATLMFNLYNEEEVAIAHEILTDAKRAKRGTNVAKLQFVAPEMPSGKRAEAIWANVLEPVFGNAFRLRAQRAEWKTPDLRSALAVVDNVSVLLVPSYEEAMKFLDQALPEAKAEGLVGSPETIHIDYPGRAYEYNPSTRKWEEFSVHGFDINDGAGEHRPLYGKKRPGSGGKRPLLGMQAANRHTIMAEHEGMSFGGNIPHKKGVILAGADANIQANADATFKYVYSQHRLKRLPGATTVKMGGVHQGNILNVHHFTDSGKRYERIAYQSVDNPNMTMFSINTYETMVRGNKIDRGTSVLDLARRSTMNIVTSAGHAPLVAGQFKGTDTPRLPLVTGTDSPRAASQRVIGGSSDLKDQLFAMAYQDSRRGTIKWNARPNAGPLRGLSPLDIIGGGAYEDDIREAFFIESLIRRVESALEQGVDPHVSEELDIVAGNILNKVKGKFYDAFNDPDNPQALIDEFVRPLNIMTGRVDFSLDTNLQGGSPLQSYRMTRRMMAAISERMSTGSPRDIADDLASLPRHSMKHYELESSHATLVDLHNRALVNELTDFVKMSHTSGVFDENGEYVNEIFAHGADYAMHNVGFTGHEMSVIMNKLHTSGVEFTTQAGMEQYLEDLHEDLGKGVFIDGEPGRRVIAGPGKGQIPSRAIDGIDFVDDLKINLDDISGKESFDLVMSNAMENLLGSPTLNMNETLSPSQLAEAIDMVDVFTAEEIKKYGDQIYEEYGVRLDPKDASLMGVTDILGELDPSQSFARGSMVGRARLGENVIHGIALEYRSNLVKGLPRVLSEMGMSAQGNRWSMPSLENMRSRLASRGTFPMLESPLEYLEILGRTTLEGSVEHFMTESVVHNTLISEQRRHLLSTNDYQEILNETELDDAILNKSKRRMHLSAKAQEAMWYIENEAHMAVNQTARYARLSQIFPHLRDQNHQAKQDLYNEISKLHTETKAFEAAFRPAVSAYYSNATYNFLSQFLPKANFLERFSKQRENARKFLLTQTLGDRAGMVWDVDGFSATGTDDYIGQTVSQFRETVHRGDWSTHVKETPSGTGRYLGSAPTANDPHPTPAITLETFLNETGNNARPYAVGNAEKSVDEIYEAMVRANLLYTMDKMGYGEDVSKDVATGILLNMHIDTNADLANFYGKEHKVFGIIGEKTVSEIISRGVEAETVEHLEAANAMARLHHLKLDDMPMEQYVSGGAAEQMLHLAIRDDAELGKVFNSMEGPARFIHLASEAAQKGVATIAESVRRIY